jgi:Flp pilus assembly pilin Flp
MMKLFRNEKGIALVSVLILSLIALSIIATLVYLVIQGTRFSGFFKRYETAREAGTGGAEITVDLINSRGKLPAITGILLTSFPNDL